jgi:para-aminobenzoate synthetase component 1
MQQSFFDISQYPFKDFKQKALSWGHQQSTVLSCLDSNEYAQDNYSRYDCLLAIGVQRSLSLSQAGGAFDHLRRFCEQEDDWYFGHLSYDLKNGLEVLHTKHNDPLACPELFFFVPNNLLIFHDKKRLEVLSFDKKPRVIFEEICVFKQDQTTKDTGVDLNAKISKSSYIKTIETIKSNIVEGEIYEMNFCQEYYAESTELEPLSLYNRLNSIANAPCSAFYRIDDFYLLCGSPERFMAKRGNNIISQPIKGTIARGSDKSEDARQIEKLQNSVKDKAENVMIVDLVRNDLAKTCQAGTVVVEELCTIYPFETVFQMISTIKGTLREDKKWIDAIKEAFPMGSMTGAPKIRSMQLIEQLEQSKRGLYSGAVGYINPQKDFDFNVVIRSILYNQASKYLSMQVGGAIVYDSDPLSEYEECLLKSTTMQQAMASFGN